MKKATILKWRKNWKEINLFEEYNLQWMSLSWQHRASSCFWLIVVQILWSVIIFNYRNTQPLLC